MSWGRFLFHEETGSTLTAIPSSTELWQLSLDQNINEEINQMQIPTEQTNKTKIKSEKLTWTFFEEFLSSIDAEASEWYLEWKSPYWNIFRELLWINSQCADA